MSNKVRFFVLGLVVVLITVTLIFLFKRSQNMNNMRDERNVFISEDGITFVKDGRQTFIKSKYVKVNNLTVHYLEAGEGETIVLVPGWPVSSKSFILMIHELSSNYHLIAPDLPGFAGQTESSSFTPNYESYIKFMHDFLNQIGEKNVNVLGVSTGGCFSLLYAEKYPENVENLIIQSAPYNGTQQKDYRGYKADLIPIATKTGIFGRTFLKIFLFFELNLNKGSVLDTDNLKGTDREIIDLCFQDLKTMNELAAFQIAENVLETDLTNSLSNIKTRTLVITGDKDKPVPWGFSMKLAKEILPNAVFVLLEGEDHYVSVNNPEKLSKYVKEFLIS